MTHKPIFHLPAPDGSSLTLSHHGVLTYTRPDGTQRSHVILSPEELEPFVQELEEQDRLPSVDEILTSPHSDRIGKGFYSPAPLVHSMQELHGKVYDSYAHTYGIPSAQLKQMTRGDVWELIMRELYPNSCMKNNNLSLTPPDDDDKTDG